MYFCKFFDKMITYQNLFVYINLGDKVFSQTNTLWIRVSLSLASMCGEFIVWYLEHSSFCLGRNEKLLGLEFKQKWNWSVTSKVVWTTKLVRNFSAKIRYEVERFSIIILRHGWISPRHHKILVNRYFWDKFLLEKSDMDK